MAYNFAAMRSHMSLLMADQDATDPAMSTADKGTLINEAYFEWFARFSQSRQLIATKTDLAANTKIVTLAQGASPQQWVTLFMMEIALDGGSVFTPLTQISWEKVRYLQESEGRTGKPDTFGMIETIRSDTTSTFDACIYPIPSVAYDLQVYVKTFPNEMGADGDVPKIDIVSARYVTRIAAARAAKIIGRKPDWIREIVATLPEWVRASFDLNKYMINPEIPIIGPGAGPSGGGGGGSPGQPLEMQ